MAETEVVQQESTRQVIDTPPLTPEQEKAQKEAWDREVAKITGGAKKAEQALNQGTIEQNQSRIDAVKGLDTYFTNYDSSIGEGQSRIPSVQSSVQQVPETIVKQLPRLQDGQNLSDASKSMDKIISMFPQKMQDFLKKFLGLFGMKFGDGTNDKAEAKKDFSKLLAKGANADILKNYTVDKVENTDGTTDLQFNKEATISKTTKKPAETTPPANPAPAETQIKVEGGKVVLAKEAQITTITERAGDPLTITVVNKDGSTDTYTVKDAKKVEPTPAATAETVPAPLKQ